MHGGFGEAVGDGDEAFVLVDHGGMLGGRGEVGAQAVAAGEARVRGDGRDDGLRYHFGPGLRGCLGGLLRSRHEFCDWDRLVGYGRSIWWRLYMRCGVGSQLVVWGRCGLEEWWHLSLRE